MANLYSYNTSSAYKYNEFEMGRKSSSIKLHTPERQKKTVTKSKVAPRARAARNLAGFLMVAICFAVAFIIVNGYVKINEAYSKVAELEAEYNDIVATNQDLQVKIDKAVDLEQLQTVAEEEFGMVRPERYQMFYVDMNQGDYSETKSVSKESKEEVAMNGVTGTITGTMNIFK